MPFPKKRKLSAVASIIAVGLLIKLLLFVWAYVVAGVPPLQLMLAHDGAEYIEYARIIASAQSGPLPAHVIRHDPGLPAILALAWNLTFRQISLPAIALMVQLISFAAAIILFARLCNIYAANAANPANKNTPEQTKTTCTWPVIAAFAVGYPAAVYYGMFNLTEPPFVALILGSVCLATSNRFRLAFLTAGIAALVRSTGLLLVAALILTHPATINILRDPKSILTSRAAALKPATNLLLCALLGVAPWIISQLLMITLLDANFTSHRPRFGLPFSGFRGIADAGAIRAIYIIAAVAFMIISAGLLLRTARRTQWQSLPANLCATFAAIFLIFHLCLKSLYYIDRTVWTFDYQDRYFIPLWPLALLAWRRHITPPIAIALATISIAISAWWLKNYLAATGM